VTLRSRKEDSLDVEHQMSSVLVCIELESVGSLLDRIQLKISCAQAVIRAARSFISSHIISVQKRQLNQRHLLRVESLNKVRQMTIVPGENKRISRFRCK